MIKRIASIVCGGYFDLDEKKKDIERLSKEIEDSNFWNDRIKAEQVISELNSLKKTVNSMEEFYNKLNDKLEIVNILKNNYDEELMTLLEEEVNELLKEIEDYEFKLMLSGEYDKSNCILEIHSGAGGTEACDWALMLYRMYTRWCEKKGYKYEEIDYQYGEEAGIKSASILIKGEYAYGYLKGEKGVHRLVRISPFDANSRRHTSFASIDVTPEFDDNIEVNIKDEDLKIDVYRSSGAGGQSVNTTDSAVRITHIPTKITITCQNERSQIKNKERALKILKNKLYMLELEKQQEKVNSVKGTKMEINFGSQIRSYTMHPYSMVKDHRTDYETSDVNGVLDGDIDEFIEKYLKGAVNEG